MTTLSRIRGPWQVEGEHFDGGKLRPVVVTIEPRCLVMRLKRTKRTFRMTWAKLFQHLMLAEVNEGRKVRVVRGKV